MDVFQATIDGETAGTTMPSSLSEVRIRCVEGMSMDAMRLWFPETSGVRGFSAPYVLTMADCFEMVRMHTRRNPAEVIEFFRQIAVKELKRPAMRQTGLP